MIRSFRRQPKASGGNGGNEAEFDEVGVNDDEGPPVPIPNTEVKLVGGENTCLATDREDSTMPTQKTATAIAAAVFYTQSAWIDRAVKQQYNWFDKSGFVVKIEDGLMCAFARKEKI